MWLMWHTGYEASMAMPHKHNSKGLGCAELQHMQQSLSTTIG